jgi:hypothetical protein
LNDERKKVTGNNNSSPATGDSETALWGSYVSDRQWGTVREDYSANGDAWNYVTHDMSRSKAYRWGEEGIAGICDEKQYLCFAIALWNKKDPILKENFFGLSNQQGNHGEDVKELYYYLDATPTHSYMKMLYKYPQTEFPYKWLADENGKRNRYQPEFEILDTGIFNNDEYFDVFVEYAKASSTDILIKITAHNRSDKKAALNILPTIWFRNTWSWGYDDEKPCMNIADDESICIRHKILGDYNLYIQNANEILFCENETNFQRLYKTPNRSEFTKDGINDYIVHQNKNAINTNCGTKAAVNFDVVIESKQSKTFCLRLSSNTNKNPFVDFGNIFSARIKDADEFYKKLQKHLKNEDERMVQRQAFAGMLWNKQFYYYDIPQWLNGDPAQPPPPEERLYGRNATWLHLNNDDIISMPDKWEYPWYAAWDLAFHCITFAIIDSAFAKKQLLTLTREWYISPAGQLPAYEWKFGDVNPPVHAWATWRVYKIDKKNNNGKGDIQFLQTVFHKLLLNFTWWVNRKDTKNNNIFEGGFLGLDNIGVFDRSKPLANGAYIEQSDGTSWMAMYALNLMRIALELALHYKVYEDLATKFFEHFLYIASAMDSMSEDATGLWDEEDQFFYDVLKMPDGTAKKLKVRSMVGLIPLFAVEVIEHDKIKRLPLFYERLIWFLDHRPKLANLVSRWQVEGVTQKHLLSLLRGHRMKKILQRMLDETEFLSDYGVRALSKYHKEHPYKINMNGDIATVDYEPGESNTDMFAGNSNWRGPVWMPVNFLIIESLQRFHHYYGDDFKVECPTNSGNYITIKQVAEFLTERLSKLFLLNAEGRRTVFGDNEKLQSDPHFKNYILFHEYFHGDNGRGIGASHQTGWTGLIAKLLQPRREE